MLRTENPEAVILDLMLPKMDGLELCRRAQEGQDSRLRSWSLTARGAEEDRVKGLDIGDRLTSMTKPFRFRSSWPG